jgi:hypothetical protein
MSKGNGVIFVCVEYEFLVPFLKFAKPWITMIYLNAMCTLDVFGQFSAFIMFIAQFALPITTSHCCAIRVARQKHV